MLPGTNQSTSAEFCQSTLFLCFLFFFSGMVQATPYAGWLLPSLVLFGTYGLLGCIACLEMREHATWGPLVSHGLALSQPTKSTAHQDKHYFGKLKRPHKGGASPGVRRGNCI